jgi:hypothetical protein
MARKKLEQYLAQYPFSSTSLIRKLDDRLWIPNLYCHRGHRLNVTGVTFDGLPAVCILAEIGEGGPREEFFLSPIINDQRKEGPVLPEGTRLRLLCPICQEELRKLVPCTCRVGAYRRALYLTPDPQDMSAVGICDTYGCPQSFVTEEGELLYEVVMEHGREK